MLRRFALAALAVVVLAGCHRPPRHVVLVVLDTVRADRMSVYGHDPDTTPFLRQHQDEMIRFERAKAPAPWTIPSHASMFTCLWPSQHRTQWDHRELSEDHLTLAEVLSAEGFETVALSANTFVSVQNGLLQGFEYHYVDGDIKSARTGRILPLARVAVLQAERERRRLFLFINLLEAHIPYDSAKYGAQFGAPDGSPVKDASIKWAVSAGEITLDDRQWAAHQAAYDAAVRSLDDAVASIYRILASAGVLDDTLLIVTSDHGDGLGAHPQVGHAISVWEEQLDVPLLVRLPHGRDGGTTVPSVTSLTWLGTTVLDWLGVKRPAAWSALPTLLDHRGQEVTADYRNYFAGLDRKTNAQVAARYPRLAAQTSHAHVLYCGSDKLVVRADGRRELYALDDDPDEQHDLAATEPRRLAACEQRYRALLASGQLTGFDLPAPPSSKRDDAEILKALGYVVE